MMRGQLRIIILRMISKQPLSGTELVSKIEEDLGWKPSYGSIYPALNSLVKEGIAIQKNEKKRKTYEITHKGKKELSQKNAEKQQLIESLHNTYKMLNSIYGVDIGPDMQLVEEVKKGNISFIELQKETTALKLEMFRLIKENKIKKNKQKIRKILNEATEKLKKI